MKKHNLLFYAIFSILLVVNTVSVHAQSFDWNSEAVFGQVKTYIVKPQENFAQIARRFDMGYFELIEANPSVDPLKPGVGVVLIIPSQYILPDMMREGIVINLAELRLYYFDRQHHKIYSFPVGIGREGWVTPQGKLSIIEKIKHPTWHVPTSIREARAKEGVFLPKIVKPGPDNPLGHFAFRLSRWNYLIHGTNQPEGVGRRSSAGCVRMYPEDIKTLFSLVKLRTKVTIVDQVYKIGWLDDQLYLESHLPLQEDRDVYNASLKPLFTAVRQVVKHAEDIKVNWQVASQVGQEQQGIPQVIGKRLAL